MNQAQDLTDLKAAQYGFAQMASMAYKHLRATHPEIHRHAHPINKRLASDDTLDNVARKIWSTLAEVALVNQLVKSDPKLAESLGQRQKAMSKLATEIKQQLRAYAAAHPEANLDLPALTHGWSTFQGTTTDLQVHLPQSVERLLDRKPFEQLLGLIRWRSK